MQESSSLTGRVCMVTGATSGIGRAVSSQLASMGATVVMVSNHAAAGESVAKEVVEESGNSSVEFLPVELSSLDSVRKLASTFRAKHDKLHIMINNAAVVKAARSITLDGLEEVFQVNYLSHFLLTLLLLDILKRSAPSRILSVVSSIHTHIDIDDLQEEKHYDAVRSYGKSKTALILFTYELSRRLKGTGVNVNCVHPGAVRTHLGDHGGGLAGLGIMLIRPFVMSPEKAARALVYDATSVELEQTTGKYFFKDKIKESSGQSRNEELARRLWDASTRLSGLSKIRLDIGESPSD